MVTAETLIELVRGSVLRPDEPVTWAKEYPDGPAVSIETASRILIVRTADDWLVNDAPWVAAVVVVTDETEDSHGPPPERVFLLLDDDAVVDLDDGREVAAFGRVLRDAGLDPLAYAEILVRCQWPGPGRREVVTDPRAWRVSLPAGVSVPSSVEAVRTWDDEHGDRWLVFHAARTDVGATGVEVVVWSVRVPPTGPATWLRRPA
jgi:hypothetical protein